MDKSQELLHLYQQHTGNTPSSIKPLPASGSNRRYYRIFEGEKSLIGAYNDDLKENEAFFHFTEHFQNKGLAVPKLLARDTEKGIYLQEDLGDQTLYHWISQHAKDSDYSTTVQTKYEAVISHLVRFQVEGIQGLDLSKAWPIAEFNRQSILWDLNYFKYCFLKTHYVPYDELALEHDLQKWADYLLQAPQDYFMYRDFQSRNIMLKEEDYYFIDYQGGRKGPAQYDLASLIYQSKAQLTNEMRAQLLSHYIKELSNYQTVDTKSFQQHFYAYVYMRIMQVLGAYGFRGKFEKKAYFIQSIPLAAQNLAYLNQHIQFPIELPELTKVWNYIADNFAQTPPLITEDQLTITINSFSYKSGIPNDPSPNGGGFVFDCRSINNPGRQVQYRSQTGRDEAVIEFLLNESNIDNFLENVYYLVDGAVENYLERKFTHLMVSFGCTGGQHRSVYSADQLAAHLKEKYPVNIRLSHIEQEKKNWIN